MAGGAMGGLPFAFARNIICNNCGGGGMPGGNMPGGGIAGGNMPGGGGNPGGGRKPAATGGGGGGGLRNVAARASSSTSERTSAPNLSVRTGTKASRCAASAKHSTARPVDLPERGSAPICTLFTVPSFAVVRSVSEIHHANELTPSIATPAFSVSEAPMVALVGGVECTRWALRTNRTDGATRQSPAKTSYLDLRAAYSAV